MERAILRGSQRVITAFSHGRLNVLIPGCPGRGRFRGPAVPLRCHNKQIPMEWRWPFCHKNEKKNMFWPWHRCVFLCLLFLATSRNNSNLVHLWIFIFSTDSSIRRICPGVQNEPVVTCHQACFGRANIPRLCFGTWSTRKRSDQSRDTLGHWSLDIGVQLSHIQLAKRHGWKICKSEHVQLMFSWWMISIWDTTSWCLMFALRNCLAWFRDGAGFVTGGEDGYVRVHHFDKDYFTAKRFE